MPGIITTPNYYTGQIVGTSFSSTDAPIISLTFTAPTGTIVLGGGYYISAYQVSDGSPVDAKLLGDFIVLQNSPAWGSTTVPNEWIVTIESTDPNGWFGGDTSYGAGLAVYASVAQSAYISTSEH